MIILLGIFLYAIIGTVVGAKLTFLFHKRQTSSYYGMEDAAFGGVMLGAFWPIGICFIFGMKLLDRELRRDKRRQEEMAEREKMMAERERLLAIARKELEQI